MSTAARVARNTVANWTGIAANSLVVLFLTPYVLHILGNERFGVYMIAHEALMYVWLLVMGMRESVTRFTCQEIAVDNVVGLNEILLGEDQVEGLKDTAGQAFDQTERAGYTPIATGPRP